MVWVCCKWLASRLPIKGVIGIENLFSNLLGKFVLIETGSLIKTLIYKKRAYREPALNSACTV